MVTVPDNLAHDQAASDSIADARALLGNQLKAVDQVIRDSLSSDVMLVNQIAEHIVASGGKRLRPMIHLLAASACGVSNQHTARLAAIIEFIHTATLLHDDVVDESALRRGRDTANAVWGNAASVLVGDFLYSRAFQMMVEIESMRVMDVLAETTNVIAEGEVLQLMHLHNPRVSEAGYQEVIRCKTAKLFEASARLGAILAGVGDNQEAALADYGLQLGLAFQLADDMLDYTGDANDLGKNVGDDLAEGKPTLPLIYLLHRGAQPQQELVRQVIEQGGRDRLAEVIAAINASDALDYTWQQARQAADQAVAALGALPESKFRTALVNLAHYAVERRH